MTKTNAPVAPGNFEDAEREFGRAADVQRCFGIKRGTAYNLLNDGLIKGCVLRVKGQKSGIRLFDMASVRAFVLSQMIAQNSAAKADTAGPAVAESWE
jgi:hypothetical protein